MPGTASSTLQPGDQEHALLTMEPASEGESDEEECKEEFKNKRTSYYKVRCFDQQSITGATSPKDPSLWHLAPAKKSYHSGIQEIMSITKTTQTDQILDFLAKIHENSVLNADDLSQPRHGWLDRADLEKEERSNQEGVAAYKAYVLDRMELIPYRNTLLGRGKVPDKEQNYTNYLYPGFIPTRGHNIDSLPQAEQKATEWKEYIERER